jgi:hypothetical protein
MGSCVRIGMAVAPVLAALWLGCGRTELWPVDLIESTPDASADTAPEAAVPLPDASVADAPEEVAVVDAAPTDATLDQQPPTGPVCIGCLAPRPIAPLSTATVTSQTPMFKWQLATGTDGASMDVCRDRACTVIVTTVTATGAGVVLPTSLTQSVYFWRLRGTSGGLVGTATSPVWEFFVGAASAAQNTSWGTTLDLDGDGYADVAIDAPNLEGKSESAYVYLGGPGGLASTWTKLTYPEVPNSTRPSHVTSAGDVDGDGFADLAIGTPYLSGVNSPTSTGAVLLYKGGPGGLSTTPVTITAATAGATFGLNLSSAGDVNGDGYADLVVGGNLTNNVAAAAFLYYGGPQGLATDPVILTSPVDAGYEFQFGDSVAGAGDINGDGYADLVFGTQIGRHAFVAYGGPSGISMPSLVLSDPFPPNQPDSSSLFGATLACAGDVNGDGFADVLVGAAGNGNDYSMSGDVFLYSGGAGGLSTTPVRLVPAGAGTGGGLGTNVAAGGDVNGDGFADILVNTGSGSYLYLGGASGPSTLPFNVSVPVGESNQFGGAIAGAGDIDGDGYDDVIVGSPYSNSYVGSAYLSMGTAKGPGPAIAVINAGVSDQLFGQTVY